MWGCRLIVDELELSDIKNVENYCDYLINKYDRIHVLINNAAQTITRPKGWLNKMNILNKNANLMLLNDVGESSLNSEWNINLQRNLINSSNNENDNGNNLLRNNLDNVEVEIEENLSDNNENNVNNHNSNDNINNNNKSNNNVISSSNNKNQNGVLSSERTHCTAIPVVMDDSGQPLDKSGKYAIIRTCHFILRCSYLFFVIAYF